MKLETKRNPWMAMIFICVSLLAISFDNTILNIALPSISRSLGAAASELQWLIDAYCLTFAALLLTTGTISDKYGRKLALQVGLVFFGIFSLIAATSASITMLIVMRALMGFAASIVMPATLSLITSTFTDPKERSKAIGMWAGVFGVGAGIGPLVGGSLLHYFSWPMLFLINIPIAVVAFIGIHRYAIESKDEKQNPIDVVGVLLSIVALFALTYGIIEAGMIGWTGSHVLLSFGVAIVVGGLFVWWEMRSPHPALPLFLFTSPSFTGANIVVTLVMFAMMGSMFMFTQFFQSVQGYSPLMAGVLMLPTSFLMIIFAVLAPKIVARFGFKKPLSIGLTIAAVGMLIIAWVVNPTTPYLLILLGMMVLHTGLSLTMPPSTDAIMGSIPVHKAGVGSAMNDTTREIGGALGVAVLGALINGHYIASVTESLTGQVPEEALAMAASSIQSAQLAAEAVGGSAGETITEVAELAFTTGLSQSLVISAGILLVTALIAAIMMPREIKQAVDPDDSRVREHPAPGDFAVQTAK